MYGSINTDKLNHRFHDPFPFLPQKIVKSTKNNRLNRLKQNSFKKKPKLELTFL